MNLCAAHNTRLFFLTLAEKTHEFILAENLIHFETKPAPNKKGTRVRSARAHSQQCTTAAVKYGRSRLSCGTTHFR